MLFSRIYLLSVWAAVTAAQTSPAAGSASATATANPSGTDPCAAAASSQLAAAQANPPTYAGDLTFVPIDAETAWQCVQSVPFRANDSLAFLDIAKQYFSFQTTLSYLKDPPAAYQQPAIDVMGRLDQIAVQAQNGAYANQYAFDVDLYQIVVQTHEEHFALFAGVLGLFEWYLPEGLISVSADGKALPQVYAASDILESVPDASPIQTLNKQPVYEFLRNYANTSVAMGLTDPNADFNQMMYNPAFQFGIASTTGPTSYYPNAIQGTLVYPGTALQGTYENGSDFTWQYTAGSTQQLLNQGLTSGQAIYQNFVLNPQTASNLALQSASVAAATSSASTPAPEPTYTPSSSSSVPSFTAVPYPNYPKNPDVLQEQFGVGGSVSGYLLKNASVGVLSLPSFLAGDSSTASTMSFSSAVAQFISDAKAAGMKQVVIDISGNGGGSIFLGYDTFKQFFPTIEPTLQFRGHASRSVNTLGVILSGLSRDRDNVIPPEAAVQTAEQFGLQAYINSAFTLQPNGSAWSDWQDFYGPVKANGDTFTHSAMWNLSSQLIADTDGGVAVAGYGNHSLSNAQPWDAKDIILLSDGSCGSTCSLFAEMMKTDAGVQTVVVGGVPEYGPMQSVSGTRGSNDQHWETISGIITTIQQRIAQIPNNTIQTIQSWGVTMDDVNALPPTLDKSPLSVRNSAINALDSIRGNSPNTPLQFTYEAADCRLFYTGAMVRDITQLWRAAATVAGGNTSSCVADSTGQTGVAPNSTVSGDPGFSGEKTWQDANSTALPSPALSVSNGASATAIIQGTTLPLTLILALVLLL